MDGPFHVRGCALRWFTSNEACDTLAAAGALVVTGDSVARHMLQALVSVLAGDYKRATGAFVGAGADNRCECDGAYDEGWRHDGTEWVEGSQHQPRNKFCREHSIAYALQDKAGPYAGGLDAARVALPHGICPAWRASHLCADIVDYSTDPAECVRAALDARGSALGQGVQFVSGGLRYKDLSESTRQQVYGTWVSGIGHRVCALLHASGENKPDRYKATHGRAQTLAYNHGVRTAECTGPGDSHFDAFAVTANATTWDGVHYHQETNVLLAQLLLNHVAALVGGSGS